MGCFYCDKDNQLYDLMTEICKLSVSTLYLFREQTYRGRCNVVYNKHIGSLHELDDAELGAFMLDVKKAAAAVAKAFSPDKINYGAYADKMQHFHMHVVPKYIDGPDWGSTFIMNPQKVYLSADEYTAMIQDIKNFL
ncbi:MAG: HIT domain-containing protein [Treponema sp.]|nr:HIT domain-containing protein [Treponema sp.]